MIHSYIRCKQANRYVTIVRTILKDGNSMHLQINHVRSAGHQEPDQEARPETASSVANIHFPQVPYAKLRRRVERRQGMFV